MDNDEKFKLDLVSKTLARDIARRNKRSTLTRGNAEQFLDAYTEAEKTGREVTIRYIDNYQITPHTLYKKVSDGLAWLVKYSEEREKWAIFRNKIRLHMSDDPASGIIIRFREGRLKSVPHVYTPPNSEWQSALHLWLNSAPDGQIFHMDKLNLSVDDKTSIENLFNSVNEHRVDDKGNPNPIVFNVTLTSIRAVK